MNYKLWDSQRLVSWDSNSIALQCMTHDGRMCGILIFFSFKFFQKMMRLKWSDYLLSLKMLYKFEIELGRKYKVQELSPFF